MSIQSINPYNGELLKEYEEHNSAYIKKAIDQGHQQFLKWKKTGFSHRSELMHSCADLMDANKEELGRLISSEMGKVIKESIAEVEKCAKVCRYYADHAEQFLKNQPLEVENGNAYIHYNPLGLVLAVMPWNFPFWQVFRFAAPALMAGNTALLKHASNVPQCALAIEELFTKAGFPKGCFTTLLIGSDKIPDILDHHHVVAATLTGSEGAGSAIGSSAGKNLKKTVLELGGSDPFIVLHDADIKKAAKTAVKSRMINNGQSCIAAKRFIIEEKVYEKFLAEFIKYLEELKKGDPLNQESDLSCLARYDLAKELLEQVKKSIDEGAKLTYGKLPDKLPHAEFPALILTDIAKDSPAYSEEFFGPVACFFNVKNMEEAIAVANDSPYGLGGSVWTGSIKHGKYVASEVESGAVYINKMMISDPSVPFGGIKRSGYGRELSHLGIREFVNQKTIWID